MLETSFEILLWTVLILCGLVGAYLFLVLGVLCCAGIGSGVLNVVNELRVRRRMRVASRFLSWHTAIDRIGNARGTLILESPTAGWNVTRAWWTPDNVLALSPAPPPDASERDVLVLIRHPFIEWCHEHYTDLDRGTAYLVAVYNGHRSAKRLVARFPGITKIDLWSGALSMRDCCD